MKRHPIPQNIMDVEFKLFGAFTIRQFGFLAICIVMALIVYTLPPAVPGIVKWPIIIFFVLLGLALAMMKVNGIDFSTWLMNFVIALTTTQRRVWKKSPKPPDYLKGGYKADAKYTTHLVSKSSKRMKPTMPLLKNEVKQKADQVDNEEDSDLQNIDMHLKQNFEQNEFEKRDTFKPTRSNEENSKKPIIDSKQNSSIVIDTALNNPDLVAVETGSNSKATIKLEKHNRVNQPIDLGFDDEIEIQDEIPTQEPEPEFQSEIKTDIRSEFESKVSESLDQSNLSESTTTDSNVESNNTQTVQNNIEQKEESTNIQQPQPELVQTEDSNSVQQDDIQKDTKLPIENTQKVEQLRSLQSKIDELENQLKSLQSDEINQPNNTNMSQKLDAIYDQLQQSKETEQKVIEPQVPHGEIQMQQSPIQRPNIISGIVVDKGDNPIPDVTIEIKDKDGFPLRKMMTNQGGQFILPTPLPNGQYILDFEKPGRNFTDYKINLNGKILPMVRYSEL